MVEVPTIFLAPDGFNYSCTALVTWTFGRFCGFHFFPGLFRDLFLPLRRIAGVVTFVVQVDGDSRVDVAAYVCPVDWTLLWLQTSALYCHRAAGKAIPG